MNSRRWVIFLSAVVLIMVAGFMTQMMYDASFRNQFNMLKTYFVVQVDFFAKSNKYWIFSMGRNARCHSQ